MGLPLVALLGIGFAFGREPAREPAGSVRAVDVRLEVRHEHGALLPWSRVRVLPFPGGEGTSKPVVETDADEHGVARLRGLDAVRRYRLVAIPWRLWPDLAPAEVAPWSPTEDAEIRLFAARLRHGVDEVDEVGDEVPAAKAPRPLDVFVKLRLLPFPWLP